MKLYAVSDGPPSLACRMAFKALNLDYELVPVDYMTLEHCKDWYAKMNPQKEIPVLDDDGFFLSESIAIMQYICDKYKPGSTLYPTTPQERAIVNHRLCFNMGFYYNNIMMYSLAPMFFDYPRTDAAKSKVYYALDTFEEYLSRMNTKYAAGNNLTIADFGLIASTLCLEAIGFDFSKYTLITKWYNTFKTENPELWGIAAAGMNELAEFEKNPPKLPSHPFHPVRK